MSHNDLCMDHTPQKHTHVPQVEHEDNKAVVKIVDIPAVGFESGVDDFEQATELPYQLTSTSVELPEAEEPELATPPSLGRHAPPTFLLGVEQEHLLAGGLSSASSSLACSLDWQEPARSPALITPGRRRNPGRQTS